MNIFKSFIPSRTAAAFIRAAAAFAAAAAISAQAFSLSSPSAPAEVTAAAKAGLAPLFNAISPASLASFGFTSSDTIKDAELGVPFKLFTITPDALEKYQSGDKLDTAVTETNQWYFPVTLNGAAKAVLIVDRMNGEWKAVSLGYKVLASELTALRSAWPQSGGYNPVLIVVFQAREYFFTVPEKDAYNITSLKSAGNTSTSVTTAGAGAKKYSALGSARNELERIKPAVEANLKDKF